MEIFHGYLDSIGDIGHRARTVAVLNWVSTAFPKLVPKIAWNQPMFTDHGTFIIGFSVSKQHLAFTPEQAVVAMFSDQIKASGYMHTKMLVQIPWESPVDYNLLKMLIDYNIRDKAACKTFWRK